MSIRIRGNMSDNSYENIDYYFFAFTAFTGVTYKV